MSGQSTSISYIYCLKDPIDGTIKYIGKSDTPNKRYVDHLRKHTYTVTKKNNWIKKLISIDEKPILEILDIVPFSEWSFWEKYWIGLFKSWGFNLHNLTKWTNKISKI